MSPRDGDSFEQWQAVINGPQDRWSFQRFQGSEHIIEMHILAHSHNGSGAVLCVLSLDRLAGLTV